MYAIFEGREEKDKCLEVFSSLEEAQENLIRFSQTAVIFVCTEKQGIGSDTLK